VPGSATPEQRLDHAERVLAGTFPLIITIMPTVITGYGLFALASRLSGVPVPEMSDVLRSLPHNPTTEMDLELWELATRIEPEPFRELSVPELAARYREGGLPPVAQREIAAFLDKYGHRGVAEIDLGVPRWSEEPGHILGVLANYLRMDKGLSPSEQFADGARQARATIAHVAATARSGLVSAVRTRRGRRRLPANLNKPRRKGRRDVCAGVRRGSSKSRSMTPTARASPSVSMRGRRARPGRLRTAVVRSSQSRSPDTVTKPAPPSGSAGRWPARPAPPALITRNADCPIGVSGPMTPCTTLTEKYTRRPGLVCSGSG
jgi:hypothetical protein